MSHIRKSWPTVQVGDGFTLISHLGGETVETMFLDSGTQHPTKEAAIQAAIQRAKNHIDSL